MAAVLYPQTNWGSRATVNTTILGLSRFVKHPLTKARRPVMPGASVDASCRSNEFRLRMA